jgi:hypothetical protein
VQIVVFECIRIANPEVWIEIDGYFIRLACAKARKLSGMQANREMIRGIILFIAMAFDLYH